MNVSIFEGDITTLEVDAIANAANSGLMMGAGVAGAILRAGGEEIQREALAKAPIEPGDAVATTAGSLKARWVVHGAAMAPDLVTSEELIRGATRRCLEVADELGARSLALPAFGTGVGGFPLDLAAAAMAGVVTAYEPSSLEDVIFAVYGDAAREAFERALAG